MKFISTLIQKIDNYQRQSRFAGFSYAVIKKYGEDEVGKKAALLTYYGFLSIFPLLLIITTLISVLTANDLQAQAAATNTISRYIPAIGDQLYNQIHSINKNGLALIAALLFTVYGARGAVESFRESAKSIWQEPVKKENLAKKLARSSLILLVGVVGLTVASVATGYVSGASNSILIKLVSVAVNVFALYWVFIVVLKISLDRKIRVKKIRLGALLAAISLVALQIIGGVIVTQQLKTLDTLYSVFALPLGLMFWIYLQAQVIYISVVATVVSQKKLWPRSIDEHHPTAADQKL